MMRTFCALSTIFEVVALWHYTLLPQLCSGDGTYENATTLMKYILGSESGYDPDVRPRDNQTQPVIVAVTFSLISLVEVDDVKQQFTMNGFLGMDWMDQRTRWDPGDFGGIYCVSPQPKNVWRPRILLLNTLGDRDLFKDDYSPLMIYDDGGVYWYPGGVIKAACALNMNKYPFDTQNCFMLFCPIAFYDYSLIFKAPVSPFQTEFYVENESWEITSTEVTIKRITTTGSMEAYSCVSLNFTLKRRPGFFILNIILPVLILSFLNNFVFVIPDQSGEKIGYGITVLLSLSVFLTTVSALIPRSSNNIPAISIYLFVLLGASVLSIMASMFVVWLLQKEEAEVAFSEAQANYKQAVNKVSRIHKALAKVDSELTAVRRRAPSDNRPGEEFSRDDVSDASRRSNKYKIIRRHVNKVCFVGFMSLWAIINMTFFIYTV